MQFHVRVRGCTKMMNELRTRIQLQLHTPALHGAIPVPVLLILSRAPVLALFTQQCLQLFEDKTCNIISKLVT